MVFSSTSMWLIIGGKIFSVTAWAFIKNVPTKFQYVRQKKKQLRADMILYVCWWNVGKSMYWKYASNAPSSYFVFFFLQVSISYFANNGDYIWDYSYVAFHNTPNISSNGRKCWIVVEQCSFSLVQIPQICDIHSAFSAKIILSIILIWIFLRGCELW